MTNVLHAPDENAACKNIKESVSFLLWVTSFISHHRDWNIEMKVLLWSTLATVIDGSRPYLGWSCVQSGHFWGWIVQKPKIIRHSVFPIQFCQTTFGRRLFWGRAIRILTILRAEENTQRNVQIKNSRTVQLIRKSAGWANAGFPKDGLWWMKSRWWHQT